MNAPANRNGPNPESLEAIGRRLKATRLALGHPAQGDFAKHAGIKANTYNQWEQGLIRPSLDGAKALCRTYRLTLDWIFLGDPSALPHGLGRLLAV